MINPRESLSAWTDLLLANLLTLTPGSLSLDVSEDRKVLDMHVMNMIDEEQTRREIKDGIERRIREILE
jgi:multicomponent Na+:H+ antiporter subunit E